MRSAIAMNKAIYLESVAGVAGDMFVASFVDAGVVQAKELGALPAQLGLDGVRVAISRVRRAEVEATHVRVGWDKKSDLFHHSHSGDHGHSHSHDHGDHHHHHATLDGGVETHIEFQSGSHDSGHTHYSEIDRRIADSKLEQPVKDLARKIFRQLAEAEASVHGYPVDEVAFHEVGAVDSIMDVVMAAYCVNKLGPCAIYASPIRPGRGFVKMAHGTHPVPPPASLKLLAGLPVAPVPAAILRPDIELSTPTGIAILKALAPRFIAEVPPGTLTGHGVGAGTTDFGVFPNVFRIVLFEEGRTPISTEGFESDRVVEIACNIDDDTAEHIAWMASQLLERGALDSWLTPVTGKKGRPAVCLSVLANESDWPSMAAWILQNGTTFGVRYRHWDRLKLRRRFERRETAEGPLTYKVGLAKDGEILKEKPEFEEVRRVWEKPKS
jgi:uncharacterized protein (TIGR00299 family) protein